MMTMMMKKKLLNTYRIPRLTSVIDVKSELWMFHRGRKIEAVSDAVSEMLHLEVRRLFATVCIIVV